MKFNLSSANFEGRMEKIFPDKITSVTNLSLQEVLKKQLLCRKEHDYCHGSIEGP
jgi:hypothetical protein